MSQNKEKQETQENKELIVKQPEEGIFITEHKMSNMLMERIVVSNQAVLKALKHVHLTKEEQEEAVDMLVHRTSEWNDLETEDQVARIKSVLTTETVLLYLQAIGSIRENNDFVEVGVDPEGSVVVYVYYTGSNRASRRAVKKKYGEEGIKEMMEATNLLGGMNIVDMAKEKMKRMSKVQEVKDPKN